MIMWYSSQSGMPKPVFWRKTIVMTSGLSFSQRSYPLLVMVFLRPELFTPQLHSLFVNNLNSLSFWHHETLEHRLVSHYQRALVFYRAVYRAFTCMTWYRGTATGFLPCDVPCSRTVSTRALAWYRGMLSTHKYFHTWTRTVILLSYNTSVL